MNEKIERLIKLSLAYEGTPLAVWARETEHPFLCKLSDLRRDFPNKLIIATDYLFSASSFTYQELLKKISISEVRHKTLNRRGSMQGGFPWTDENFSWPVFDNGKAVRPSIQLNMREIGEALGLALPQVIYQYWGEESGGVRVIKLEDIEDKEPDWSYPDFSAGSDLVWPDDGGWIFEPDPQSGEIDWVGNTISVGNKAFEMPDMELFFKDEDSDEPETWRDVSLWLQANGLLYAQADFISKRLTEVEAGYLPRRDDCYAEFEKVLKSSRCGPGGKFLDKDCYLPGDIKYHELVLRGGSCLYNPGALKERNPLQFYDASVIIIAKPLHSSLPPRQVWEVNEIGHLYSQWNRSINEDFAII